MYRFPRDVAGIILGYSLEWTMTPNVAEKLPKPIIGPRTDKLWSRLSLNPRSGDFLDRHPELICWRYIAANPSANHLTFSDHTKKRFSSAHGERNAFGAGRGVRPVFLDGQRYYVNIAMLCRNSSEAAITVLQTLPLERIVWDSLSNNTHPWAIKLLSSHPEKIRHYAWRANSAAADHIISAITNGFIPDVSTCSNPNPKIVSYLQEHLDLVHPKGMLRNPGLALVFLGHDSRWSEYVLQRPNWHRELGTLFDMARNPNPRAIAYHLSTNIICEEDLIVNPGIFELTEPEGLRELLGIPRTF